MGGILSQWFPLGKGEAREGGETLLLKLVAFLSTAPNFLFNSLCSLLLSLTPSPRSFPQENAISEAGHMVRLQTFLPKRSLPFGPGGEGTGRVL